LQNSKLTLLTDC